MARRHCDNKQAVLVCDIRNSGWGISIRVTDPVTVFFSTEQGDLDFVDATGNPTSGLPLTNTDQPLVYPEFTGKLYARTNVALARFDFMQFPRYTESVLRTINR